MKTLLFSTIMLMSTIYFAQTIICETQLDSGKRFQEYYVKNNDTIKHNYELCVNTDSPTVFPKRFRLVTGESQIATVRRRYKGKNIIKFELILKY